MLSNFHTHTDFCDGKSTIDEIVLKAIEKGFDAIGFSGHAYTDFDNSYCMQDTAGYIMEVRAASEKYKNKIQVYLGTEEDIFGEADRGLYDYIIGSSHYIKKDGQFYDVDGSYETLKTCINAFGGDTIAYAEAYFNTFCQYILRRKPDIVGHFDLIEKFNSNKTLFDTNSDEYKEIVREAVKVIAENCPGQIFEVNTGAMYRLKNDLIYPSSYIMECIKEYGMNVTINSDSHCVNSLDFGFETALNYCRNHGFKSVYMLKNGIFEEICI